MYFQVNTGGGLQATGFWFELVLLMSEALNADVCITLTIVTHSPEKEKCPERCCFSLSGEFPPQLLAAG